MSYHDATRRIADEFDGDYEDYDNPYMSDDVCPDCGCEDCECAVDSDGYDDSDEGRLRQKITDAMPEGDPEAYMASGQELLDELLANPDRTKLGLILDKEIEELNALLGDTSDIDLESLKDAALAAFDAAAEKSGPSKGAVMAALAAIKSAAGRALGALGLG